MGILTESHILATVTITTRGPMISIILHANISVHIAKLKIIAQ